jgi:hypothetical protein
MPTHSYGPWHCVLSHGGAAVGMSAPKMQNGKQKHKPCLAGGGVFRWKRRHGGTKGSNLEVPEHISRMVGHANLLYASNK